MGTKGASAWEEYKKTGSFNSSGNGSHKVSGGAAAWAEYTQSDNFASFIEKNNSRNNAKNRTYEYLKKVWDYYESAQRDYAIMNWGNASDLYAERTTSSETLKKEGTELLDWLKKNQSVIGSQDYNTLRNQILEVEPVYDDVLSVYGNNADFYGQFATEDDYLKWDAYSTTEKRQATYQQNMSRLEELKKERDELYRAQYADASTGMIGAEDPDSNQYVEVSTGMIVPVHNESAPPKQKKLYDVEKEIASLEAEINMYQRGITDKNGDYIYGSKVIDYYSKWLTDPAYEQYSGNRDYDNPSWKELAQYDAYQDKDSWTEYGGGTYKTRTGQDVSAAEEMYKEDPGYVINDPVGLFLSIPEQERALQLYRGSMEHLGMLESVAQAGWDGNWEQLTDDELGIYYTIKKTQGDDAAMKYISDMTPELNRRGMYAESTQIKKEFDEANGWKRAGLSAASAPIGLMGGVMSTFDNVGNILQGNEINPYSRVHAFRNYSDKIRTYQAQEFDDAYKWEIPWVKFSAGDLYQSGMSVADTLLGAMLGAKGYQAIMSSGAAASKMQEYYEKGASDAQIATMGAAAAFAEWITEKYSIESLLKIKDIDSGKQIIKALFYQAFPEATEEMASDVINYFADAVVMGTESEWQKALDTHDGNYLEALWSFADEVAAAGVSGFFSGIGSGGGKAVGSYVGNYANDVSTGRSITDGKGYNSLMNLALEMGKEKSNQNQRELMKQSERILNKDYATDISKQRDLGRLHRTVQKTVNDANVADISKALQDNGYDKKTADSIADAFYAAEIGNTLTEDQSKVVNKYGSDEKIQQIVGDIILDYESSVGKRNRSIRNFEYDVITEQLRSRIEKAAAEKGIETAQETEAQKTDFNISEDGKAHVISSGKAVDITAFASAKDGKVMLRTSDGEVVPADDVSYANESQAIVFETIASMGISAKSANILLEGFKGKTGVAAEAYAVGLYEAFEYGQLGIAKDELRFSNALNKAQLDYAYRQGQKAEWKTVKEAERQLKKNRPVAKEKTEGRVYFDGDRTMLNERQMASMKSLEVVAKALGVKIYVFESEVDAEGKHIGENGSYNPADGSIRIDLYAGNDANSVMLFTAAHELTHFIKQWSPAKFKILADFLLNEYRKNDISVNELIQAQIDKAANSNRKLTRAEAYEEVVADSMESMLADGNVVQHLAKLRQKAPDMWEKIKEFINDLVTKIRNVYSTVAPDSQEGRYVAQMKDSAEKLQRLFEEALVQASDNYQSVDAMDIVVDSATESVAPDIKMSERTWTESDYVQERDKAAAEIAKAIDVSEEKAKNYIDSVNSIAKMIADDRTRLDYFSSPNRSSFVGNVEYGGSFDFSTLCKKRRLLTGTFTAIQKALPNTALTADEILDIRNRMKAAGLEVSCGLCYVEGSRANMGQFAKEFLKLHKKYYPDSWQPNMADVNTPEGIEWVRINHPDVYEQYEYFWNHYGTLKQGDKNLFASQQKPKLYQLHTEYKGEILKKFKDEGNIEDKNLNGGIRLQSFSDFEIVHLIDTMQIIMDMSRVGLAGQAYTKVPDFAWALGDTGLKINLSLIAKGVDENGSLIFDDVEGMPIADAMALRDRYSKNVGTILVAFNDEQLRAAMADDRVDFIIPFHRSQWKKSQYAAMGLPAKTKDYTYMQNEKFIKPQYHEYRGRMVKDKATNYMPNEYWDFSKSGKENAEAYLEMCARNNKRPKFYKLLQNNGDGSYSLKADGSTDGYWKLLIDFKMYDNQGAGSPQTAVTPNFNMKEARRMMDEYKGGHNSFPSAKGIVDDFVTEYKKKHSGIKYSDRGPAATKFSLRETTEETKDLLAFHNITAKLLTDVLNRNGLLMPSLAITNKGMNDFGEISLLFDKSTIDPSASSENKLYGADAWTPTQTQLKKNAKFDTDKTVRAVNTMKNHIGSKYVSELFNINPKQFRDAIIKADGSIYDAYAHDIGVQTAYAMEKGIITEIPTKKNGAVDKVALHKNLVRVLDTDEGWRQYKRWLNNISDTVITSYDTATNADILKNMKAQPATAKAFKLSETGELVVPAVEYSSLDDARKNRARLSENAEQETKAVAAEFLEFADSLGTDRRSVVEAINATYADRYSTADIAKSFRAMGIDITSKEAATLRDLYKKAVELPTQYFEAKPHREVGLDEIKAVVIPTGIKYEGLRSKLSDMGIEVIEYSEGSKESRVNALNSVQRLKFSERDATSMSNRAVLVRAFDSVITDEAERKKLDEYRENIDKLNEQEAKLRDLKSQIKELSFAKGPRDTKKIAELREEAAKTENRINLYDKRLFRFEASSTLQKVLQREKAKVAEREKAKRVKGMEDYQRGEEVKLAELIRKYRATREALTQQKRDTTTMEAEFIRLVKQYEKLSAKSNASNKTSKDKLSDLRTALKEEAKAHKDDQKQWEKEFDRLLKEYEHSEKRIDLLEAKIKAQRKSASARVDSRNRTEMRKKIRRVIRDLDKLLNRGTKKQNVKEGMRDFVAAALASAEALFTETYTTEDMISYGVKTDTTAKERKLLAMAKRILDQISNLPKVADVDDVNALMKQETDLKKELSVVKSQLKGVFERERYRLSGFTASELFGELANSYANLAKAGDNYIRGAYREEIYQRLLETQTDIGAVRVADMSLEQLDMVYDSYAMVLQAVRDANKMFVFGRNVTRDDLARSVLSELKNAIKAKRNISKAGKLLNSFAWNNLKPIYAFERIGSSTLAELYANIRKGQDVWALDMREAYKFRRSMYDKYNRKGWDMDKKYTFKSSTGLEFSLNLEQIMSLYAYSKRAQAHDHLLKGGIVFDKDTEVTEYVMGVPVTRMLEDATAYKLSLDTLEEIVGELDDQQKSFVNDLQTYLSKTMGNKGNDVSMQLYGIKLFKEENYFPIKSAEQYMEKTREDNLQKEQGQINLVNAGFAKSTVPDASKPIVLSGFMETWANHVAEMSMYHAFVLPMEDFRRVYDFSTPNLEGEDSDSVYAAIQNAHGTAATAYIDQLYRDLNGGVVADPRENIAKKMIGLFKQGAVMASSSVVIQQLSALVRSFAMIDPKYFGALPIVRGAGRVLTDKVHHQHQQLWEELKKYAPVAMIKEMGYFDTGMGRSAVDFLLTEEYHGFGEKAKGFFTDSDYRGEVLSKAAAKADELTWIQIWNAVKNETAARNPDMNRNSEVFLKIAGERFSEVIDRTQVYDSVFARSGNMRSKSVYMNIATAFMAEPTTSINMIEDAVRKLGKGHKRAAARVIGAVFLNILLNSALVSLIYAARDDDEDETYLEKYVSSFVTESMDGLNPMTYYPFLKDVWSILQGYDVERADLSLVTDAVDAMKNLVKLHGKDTSDMDEEEISEHNKKIQNEWLKALDGMTAFMGLPVKNVRRDFNGAINMYKTLSADFGGRTTTIQSIGDVLQSDVSKSVPVLGWLPQKTKADKLFDALVSGDTAYIDRLKATYKDEDAYKSAIRTVIGERFVNGKIGANEASRYLVLHGGLDGSEARGYIDEWSMEIDVGIVYDDLRKQFVDQKVTESEAVDYLVKYGGKREEDAEKTVREWGLEKDTGIPYAKMKEVFLDRGISESEAVDYMVEYGGKKRDAAEETVNKWRLELETGIAYEEMKTKFIDEDISESEAVDYMVEYGCKKQKDAEAIIKQWTFEKDTGIPYDDMKTAFLDEKISESEAIKYRVEYGGAKQKDAEKTVSLWKFEAENTWDYENRKSLYLDGEISAATLKKALIEFGDYEPEDAELQVQAYDWQAEGYENVTTEAVRDYNEYCAAANVPKDIYMYIRKFANSTENDVVNGEKVPYSAVKKIMREINSQTGLTSAQKTAIARSIGWKDSTIEKYKLW